MTKKIQIEWQEVELGEVCKILNGFAFDSKSFNEIGEGLPLIRIRNISKGYTNTYYSGKYSEEYLVNKGDLLIGMDGEFNIFKWVGEIALLNQRVCKLIPNPEKIYGDYLSFILIQKLKEIENKTPFVTVKHISSRQISSIKLNIPSLQEQQRIVAILEKSERLKEQGKKANELLDEYLKSLFYEMFWNKEFEKKRLGEIARITMGGTPSTSKIEYWKNGTINWMKSGDIKGDFIHSIPNKITKLGLDNSNTEIYPSDTVVIALNGQGKTRGTTGILKIGTTSNQSVAGILLERNKVLPEYAHYNLKFRYQELRNITGDDARSGLNLTILRNLPISLPPLVLQQKFASIVKKVEEMKENVKKTQINTEDLFNSLMQKAFRGEL